MEMDALSPDGSEQQLDLTRIMARLGVDISGSSRLADTLPFAGGDATAGCENELQTAVLGSPEKGNEDRQR